MKLWKHQLKILKANPKKHVLVWSCGTGKSLAAIELAKKNKQTALVICPKSIKKQWQEDSIGDDWVVVTKEEFRRDVKKLPRFNCLIVDEIHNFLSPNLKSQMYKSLLWYIQIHKPEFIYGLSATVYMSSIWNIFALAKILGYNPNYGTWRKLYFYPMRMGRRLIYQQKDNLQDVVSKMVKKLGSTVRMDECFDVPEQTFQTEYFELTAEQKKAIKNITDLEHIVKWSKSHQVCGGTLKSDGYTEDQEFASEKMNRAVELANQHKKLIIVCKYNHEIKILSERLKSLPNLIVINGATKDRHSAVKMAEASSQCVVLVNGSVSEGYQLPTFPIMIFYSYNFSLKDYIQITGRILRADHLKKNVYISLVVKDKDCNIDYDVYDNIVNKKIDFQIKIYEKA